MDIVQFPGLWGLEIPVKREAFEILGLPIYWYGIIIAFAFLVAVLLGIRDSRKFDLEPDNIIDLFIVAAPVAIIGARLYYVIFSWGDFKNNPIDIFNIRIGGLAIYGGIIGAIISAAIFARVKKIEVFKLFDFGAPYLVLGQAIGRWGNFVNREAFGTNTTLPWGMTSSSIQSELARLKMEGMSVNPDLPVHPTFLYESLWDLAVFFILIWYRKRKKINGEVFFLYMVLYGIGRFFIEGIRLDSLYIGNLRVSQMLAFLFVILFGMLFILRRMKAAKMHEEVVETGSSKYGQILKKMQEEEALEQAAEGQPLEQQTVEQVNVEQTTSQENVELSLDEKNVESAVEQKTAEQPADHESIEQTVGQENAEQPVEQENTEQ